MQPQRNHIKCSTIDAECTKCARLMSTKMLSSVLCLHRAHCDRSKSASIRAQFAQGRERRAFLLLLLAYDTRSNLVCIRNKLYENHRIFAYWDIVYGSRRAEYRISFRQINQRNTLMPDYICDIVVDANDIFPAAVMILMCVRPISLAFCQQMKFDMLNSFCWAHSSSLPPSLFGSPMPGHVDAKWIQSLALLNMCSSDIVLCVFSNSMYP